MTWNMGRIRSLLGIIAGADCLGCGLFLLFLKLRNLKVSLYFFDDFVITIAFAAVFVFLGILLFVASWQGRNCVEEDE
jgi:hypothetical protein